ncbi:ferritin-like domain-containing protein [Heliobacterium gestii]|uniref:Ferritin-like domain-containing protein n=1 Tax=Heliomicrobium gestii TaxID=2699 RepID=A0A845L936_HELGE|nr:ferritin-like domain-containing protein [Heliomicrobium gestii]MBM7865946.1 rubrerythrin [Heliomicrobium gestii]MZP42718.1 ferritin-like domain-containing protein [Heliomicrobium gestii]
MPSTSPPAPYPGYPFVTYRYYPTHMYTAVYALPEALRLIVESVKAEREDDLFYDYMLNAAPRDQKDIVASIRDDERKHGRMLREIYWQVTGQEAPAAAEATFERPINYCEGIRKALFGELGAVERYRKVLNGFEFLPYRNMITEIYTDELRHASKWNYLFTVNCR